MTLGANGLFVYGKTYFKQRPGERGSREKGRNHGFFQSLLCGNELISVASTKRMQQEMQVFKSRVDVRSCLSCDLSPSR